MTFPSTEPTRGRQAPAWAHRWRFPLLLVAMLVVMALAQKATVALSDFGPLDLVVGVAAGVATLFCYRRLSRFLERRQSVGELPRDRAWSRLLWGVVVGAGAFLSTMLVVFVSGGGQLATGNPGKLLATTGIMVCTAVTEEVVFRGIVFRVVEARFGTWVSLAASAVLFGVVHLAGGSDTDWSAMLWGALAIVLQGGILLGAAYVATRALWMPIGIHFAWNLVEAGFGTAVSGKTNEFGSVVHTTLSGPTWLTGGSFGPEAGAAAILERDEPRAVGEHHGLDAVAHVELRQDARHVGAYGLDADRQLRGDFGVGHTAGDQAQDLALPRGQQTERVSAGGSPWRAGSGRRSGRSTSGSPWGRAGTLPVRRCARR